MLQSRFAPRPLRGAAGEFGRGALILLALPLLAVAADPASPWKPLPTGDRDVWEACQFGGDGEVRLEDEAIFLGMGDPLTGVRCLSELPKEGFEIALEARRVSGIDFFCGLTFPVGEEGRCSLILAGWAGTVVGLSNVDGEDASRNRTSQFMKFDDGRWYAVRVRVDEQRIAVWIDQRQIIDQPREGHTFDIRPEMEPSAPWGIAAFQCEAEIRKIRWQPLDAPIAPSSDTSAVP
jgi:hypothetical protein